jgi:hypothetical protein
MKTKKTIPTSLLKEISDKNYKNYKTGYSIDMDMLMEAHPEMTEIEFYEPAVYRGGKLAYQVCFVNPGRGLWLSQSMTKSQVQEINKLTGGNLFKLDIENVYELQN